MPESTYVSITRALLGFAPFIGPYLDLQDAHARQLAAHDAYVNGNGTYSDYAKAAGAELLAGGFLILDALSVGFGETAVVFAKASGRNAIEHEGQRWLRTPTTADKAEAWRKVGGTCPDCGVILTNKPGPNQMNLDHPEAYSTHGPIDPSQSIARCRTCNLEKSNISLSDWNEYQKHGIWTSTKEE